MFSERKESGYPATKNACKLCTPLGASLAFKGIEDAVPFLHGSQGCSTYIRRYLISHFKEPVDIACSNFGEETAIFGGGANLKTGLENIRKQYDPELIGIATTCLSETIGDDVRMFIREYKELHQKETLPHIVHVSTPSYQGTHIDGFHAAVRGIADVLASDETETKEESRPLNIFPGMVSPADLRHLKEILSDFGVSFVMLPDYSQTLDGPLWSQYRKIPPGGTKVRDIRQMGTARASIEFGKILAEKSSAGKLLQKRFRIPCFSLGLPVGINESDKFFDAIKAATGKPMPLKYEEERGRLIDAYVDGHKYVSQSRAVVYVCASFRASGEPKGTCNKKGSADFLPYIENEIADRGMSDVVLSSTSCFKACDYGPVMVIYPENYWYGNVESQDVIDAILDALEEGKPAKEYLIA
jgi:nitrogenase molybdenum-iron protein NifN